jgi:hypothetical protein
MAADRTPTGGRNDLNAMCGNSIEASRRTADNLSVKDPKSGHFTESQKVNSLFPSLFLQEWARPSHCRSPDRYCGTLILGLGDGFNFHYHSRPDEVFMSLRARMGLVSTAPFLDVAI